MSDQPPETTSLLNCVADCLGWLLEPGEVSDVLPGVLALVGTTVGVDRVYLFENHGPPNDLKCNQTYEWVREGIEPQISNPDLQNLSYLSDLEEIYPSLASGRNFTALVGELSSPLRENLESQHILSIALVPMFFGGVFGGFVGFDDCCSERVWATDEMHSLRAVAAGIGSALVRSRIEHSVKARADELSRSRRVALGLMEDAQNAVREAEAANRAKSAFLAMMSHEIRTPLNGVIGFTDLLLAEKLSPHHTELVNTIKSCGTSLLALISDILDLSKIEAGRFELDFAACSPAACLEEVTGSFAPALGEKRLRLTKTVDANVPATVITDGKRLRQILFNLVGNAVKFTSSGSIEVSLRATPVVEGTFMLSCTVVDSGIGMSEEELAAIFEPFGQANAAIHRRFGGSGLGLTICRNLIRAMGGEISVSSTPGKGTRFVFEIPCRPTEQPSGDQEGDDLPAMDPNLRLLVVDDVATNVRLVSGMLRRLGCTADTASDGREAAALVKEKPYDIVLMDILMPVCDGIEATRAIRDFESNHPERKRTWIIALTADAFADNRARCLDAGMDDFITKPVRMDAIHSALARGMVATRRGEPAA